MEGQKKDNIWLQRAEAAYTMSTSYMDTNYRKQWENSERHFQNKHQIGSKYYKESYRYRSKFFRPKTRSMMRNNEAAASAAYFGNMDLVSIEPQDPNNKIQQASADVNRSLLDYRLQNSIPWFLTCIGAFQDAQKVGCICSYQDWEYRTVQETFKVDALNPETGLYETTTAKENRIIADQPRIRLLPIENVRIHPHSDWMNPIKSSPFLTVLWPMFVKDVRLRMKNDDEKTGRPKWVELNEGELITAQKARFDSTRLTREGNREDPLEKQVPGVEDFDIIWVHENYMNIDGNDVCYYTLGTEYMLDEEPYPIEEIHFTGERPVVMGIGVLETHKVYPDSLAHITSPIQREVNEVTNSRRDNVFLVLNKRYLVKRGSQTDLRSIVRNVPASITLTGEPTQDVVPIEFNDVTGSSYMEQDRLNAEYDSLSGGFDTASVQTNRNLNETVGGMRMMRSGSMSLTDYLIKTFSETWVEPVIKQLIKLEQKYETDNVILAIAAQKAQIWQRYGIDRVTDDLLNQTLTITVSAGDGASDPTSKLQRFLLAAKSYVEMAASQSNLPIPVMNIQEAGKEIFGRLGYKDGTRFIYQQDKPENQLIIAQIQQMKQVIGQLQTKLQDKEADRQAKLIETKMKEDAETSRTQMEEAGENRRLLTKLAADLDKLYIEMGMKREEMSNSNRLALVNNG